MDELNISGVTRTGYVVRLQRMVNLGGWQMSSAVVLTTTPNARPEATRVSYSFPHDTEKQ